MFQADGKPWVGAHVAYTEEDTGDKGHAVVRVLADDECLPLGAEDNFFVGDHAGHAYGVDGDAVNIGAAGAVEGLGGGVGHGRQVGGAPGGGDAFGGVDGGAAGCIEFVGVVVFDDFGGVEEAGGLFCELHGEDRGDGEVGGDEAVGVVAGGPGFDLGEAFGGESGGADHAVNAMGEAEFEVVHDNVGGGEVDDDVRLSVDKRLEGVVAVDLGDEF